LNRTPINPSEWGLAFSMNQAEVVEALTRHVHFPGQVALEADATAEMGIRVVHVGDMRGQIGSALANIDAILEQAGMTRGNILFLRFFTTDIASFLDNYDVYASWIGEAQVMPPQTLLGVNSLAVPELLVEIEATAGA
jgi:enamine deaminase RidA (YjgF/YER057c/UK114 family)